jgi:hypothetical protein
MMCEVITETTIEKVYEAFASCGLELSDTAKITAAGDEGWDNILTFTVSGQTGRGDWFYGNLPLYEEELHYLPAWEEALEICTEPYGDLYVRNLVNYGYDPASETDAHEEVLCRIEQAKQAIERLGEAA